MFGMSVATLKTLRKRIDVDQELALALWHSGNYDAALLVVKVADSNRLTPSVLDRWAGTPNAPMCASYVGLLAVGDRRFRIRAR